MTLAGLRRLYFLGWTLAMLLSYLSVCNMMPYTDFPASLGVGRNSFFFLFSPMYTASLDEPNSPAAFFFSHSNGLWVEAFFFPPRPALRTRAICVSAPPPAGPG